jgi:hypothetical protein
MPGPPSCRAGAPGPGGTTQCTQDAPFIRRDARAHRGTEVTRRSLERCIGAVIGKSPRERSNRFAIGIESWKLEPGHLAALLIDLEPMLARRLTPARCH